MWETKTYKKTTIVKVGLRLRIYLNLIYGNIVNKKGGVCTYIRCQGPGSPLPEYAGKEHFPHWGRGAGVTHVVHRPAFISWTWLHRNYHSGNLCMRDNRAFSLIPKGIK
jgi:hypothetical protein